MDNKFVFGTYRPKGKVLEVALDQAMYLMTNQGYENPLIDTAISYHNDEQILACLSKHPTALVGSKLKSAEDIFSDLSNLTQKFGKKLFRVLLHKYMPCDKFEILVDAKRQGLVQQIGVCNYSILQLEELIKASSVKPDIVQNEFHPFLHTEVTKFCKDHGIRFEAHSIMTCMDAYVPMVNNWGMTAAQAAVAFALQAGGGGVCISTVNYAHLIEDLQPPMLEPQQIDNLLSMHRQRPYARFKGSNVFQQCPCPLANDDDCVAALPRLLDDLLTLRRGGIPSDLAFAIPKRPLLNPVVVRFTKLIFPNLETSETTSENASVKSTFGTSHADEKEKSHIIAAVHRLSHQLKRLRKRVIAAHEASRASARRAGSANTCKLVVPAFAAFAGASASAPLFGGGGTVERPAPLPVSLPERRDFDEFLATLASLPAPPPVAMRFERGTLFPDGRMDLCKQVTRPVFTELCEAVGRSGAVRHFLLGNNLALDPDIPASAAVAIAAANAVEDDQPHVAPHDFPQSNTGAGGEKPEEALADWPEACSGGGDGVGALVRLMERDPPVATWYLAGNGVGPAGAARLAEALERSGATRDVWLKMNPLGPTGAAPWGRLAARNPRVRLLDLFNTGLGDAGLAAFLAALLAATPPPPPPTDAAAVGLSGLRHLYLDINGLTAASAEPLVRLLGAFPRLHSLSLSVNRLGDAGTMRLAAGLAAGAAPALRRLTLGSNGAGAAALLAPLAAAVEGGGAGRLVSVELGTYKSTRFFGERANRLEGPAAREGLLRLGLALRANADAAAATTAAGAAVDESDEEYCGGCYLGFEKTMDADAEAEVGAGAVETLAAAESESVVGAGGLNGLLLRLETAGVWFNGVQVGGVGRATPHGAGLRRCKQPRAVDHIQSIYRNSM